MRHLRLRLRTAILVVLATLSLFFLTTLYTLIWSTNELESGGKIPEPVIPPGVVTFWSAINHPNIYDLHATLPNSIFVRRANITPSRIDELYQLVHDVRTKISQTASIKRLFPVDPKWHFEQVVEQQRLFDKEEEKRLNPDAQPDTPDSETVDKNATTSTKHPLSTLPPKAFNEHDRVQLRNYVHRKLADWKHEHQHDKIVTIAELFHEDLMEDEPARLNSTWYDYMKTVNNLHVYDPHSAELKQLLHILQNGDVIEASEMTQGTQIKVIFDLPGGFEGLFKPYRVPRNYQTLPDHFYFSDIERHHAEIAAFHLDRILGFYRVPPLIGRHIHITHDIRERATEELGKTFFTSPANNTCFRGHCSYYCDTSHAVCGKPGDQLEGSVQVLLPRPPELDWDKIIHPYRRSYSAVKKAKWENNENYCYSRVFTDEEYHTRLLLDMMDLSAFDFLIGNMDRHHMMRIETFGANSALIHLDNGRSFGRYDHDELSILTPIRQCCFFRYSTFTRLYGVYRQGLSTLLSRSLQTGEQLRNILIDEHLSAVDRRLEILFAHLDTCIKTYTVKGVFVDDGVE